MQAASRCIGSFPSGQQRQFRRHSLRQPILPATMPGKRQKASQPQASAGEAARLPKPALLEFVQQLAR